MSTVTNAVTTCPDLQTTLNENFLICSNYAVDPITLLPYLYSSENRSGIDFRVSPVPGKKRTLLAVYSQIISDDEVDVKVGCDKTCIATTERGDLSTEYTIDCGGYMVEGKYDPALWMASCTDNYKWINDQLLKMIAALDNKISKGVVSLMGPLVGDWATEVQNQDADDYLVVETLVSGSTYQPNPNAWGDIDLATMQTGYCAPKFVAGGTLLYKYMRFLEAGCCASYGVNLKDLMDLYGQAVTYDLHVANTFGNNVSLMLQQGAVQLLTLNHNGGGFSQMQGLNVSGGNTYAEYIINSPYTGLPYDLTIKYDCGVVHVILEGNVKPVGLPLDMFPAAHRMEGVTFVNGIKVTNT